jgi:NAD+ kinase
MKVGIYGQFYHEDSGIYIKELFDILDHENIEVCIEKNFLDLIHEHKILNKNYKHFSTFKELDATYDLFFSIGGDGTILKSINYIQDLNIPILGINTGRLGFLATIHRKYLMPSITAVIFGG